MKYDFFGKHEMNLVNRSLVLILMIKLTLLLLCQKILIKRLLNNGWGFLYAVSASWNVAYATSAESGDPS